MGYQLGHAFPIESSRSERATFIRRTYAHLAGAILAFVGLEALIFGVLMPNVPGFQESMRRILFHPGSQLVVLLAFIGVSYLARYWAFNGGSPALQYAGLALYVVAEVIIFVPILFIAINYTPNHGFELLSQAGILTLALCAGLTSVVLFTRKDFSFLGPIIMIASSIALGVIICAMFTPIGLGFWFSIAMIVLAAASILYNTSAILHQFRMDQHVAASLCLFASVAMLFYYVLLALMQRRS